jgi:hypothetical protein
LKKGSGKTVRELFLVLNLIFEKNQVQTLRKFFPRCQLGAFKGA